MAAAVETREEAYGPVSGERHRRLLWVVGSPTQEHVEVWDALRSGAALTVVVLDPAARDGAFSTEALAGRGYPVLRVPARGRRAPGAVRGLLHDRPDAVILDGLPPRSHAAAARWAQRSAVPVVTASAALGPAAAARAALATGAPGSLDLDLRAVDDPTVIDLDSGSGAGQRPSR
jgi:hypothetical protein